MTGSSRTKLNYHCDEVISRWVSNPTLTEFCFDMIGRADIKGSKSDVALNAWPPQASYPCRTKGSIVHTFMVCIHTKNQNQGDFPPFCSTGDFCSPQSPPLGHLRYDLTDVPPQPDSPTC
ncbi:hypothetical protein F5883DRAFT_607139 [Diaporthe sp. PMI_573]|nr:hypothetical protein F5883DRAFT_607139 [Diaporthaceae sp. PMI_573]